MDKNLQLIWTNRVLRVFSVITGIVGGLVAVVAMVGDVVKTIQGLGLVPNKWLGIAGGLVTLGTIAATYSKTPSQAIAAAVPPGKTPPPG
jgi:hypothetical protein